MLTSALGLAVLLTVRAAFADDAQQFELGKTRFDTGQYEEAAARFASMLDPSKPPCDAAPAGSTDGCRLVDSDLIERARALYAASLVALKRLDEADAQIATILRNNPAYTPNPAVFPQEVIDRFTLVRARLRAELEELATRRAEEERRKRLAAQRARDEEQRWIQSLVAAASKERVVVKNSRLVAAVPFGIGQFQNGDTGLGWAFAISEAAVGATSIVAAQVWSSYASIDARQYGSGAPLALAQNLNTARLVNQIAFGVWGALTAIGIAQAEIGFVPEKVIERPRPLPPRPKQPAMRMVPTVAIAPGTFNVGVVGSF